MLQLLKESVSSKHAERLEQIVIALIAIEIGASLTPPAFFFLLFPGSNVLDYNVVLGIVTILVDVLAA